MLRDYLETLVNSSYSKTQLDIISNKKTILLQVFNHSDIKEWNISFHGEKDKGLIVCLTFEFKELKTNVNYRRFISTDYFEKFSKFELEHETFLMYIPPSRPMNEVVYEISKIIKSVYDLKGNEEIEIYVNTYQ